MQALQAIETRYKGYRFRSRLEARWAVFFDALGVEWEYEKEGYDLGEHGWYLPDFWLPEQACWIEIKGKTPTDTEWNKAMALSSLTETRLYLFFGPIPSDATACGPSYEESDSAYLFTAGPEYIRGHTEEAGGDIHHCWCECPDCGAVGIRFDARADRLPCKECDGCARYQEDMLHLRGTRAPCPTHGASGGPAGCKRHGGNLDKGYNGNSPRLLTAYVAARSARFEHGEG